MPDVEYAMITAWLAGGQSKGSLSYYIHAKPN